MIGLNFTIACSLVYGAQSIIHSTTVPCRILISLTVNGLGAYKVFAGTGVFAGTFRRNVDDLYCNISSRNYYTVHLIFSMGAHHVIYIRCQSPFLDHIYGVTLAMYCTVQCSNSVNWAMMSYPNLHLCLSTSSAQPSF